ncbi:RMP1 [Candida oxycetoniae]|uniref:RMP1 n=1 Tax=Candida oxycetoniae TaxID=497107 RepID=A0AAI9T082_9ASCO|nr:RMP1 [Candida oxycetoniae]KAI3406032.2 RMP1 [Candida oxycetoniae]
MQKNLAARKSNKIEYKQKQVASLAQRIVKSSRQAYFAYNSILALGQYITLGFALIANLAAIVELLSKIPGVKLKRYEYEVAETRVDDGSCNTYYGGSNVESVDFEDDLGEEVSFQKHNEEDEEDKEDKEVMLKSPVSCLQSMKSQKAESRDSPVVVPTLYDSLSVTQIPPQSDKDMNMNSTSFLSMNKELKIKRSQRNKETESPSMEKMTIDDIFGSKKKKAKRKAAVENNKQVETLLKESAISDSFESQGATILNDDSLNIATTPSDLSIPITVTKGGGERKVSDLSISDIFKSMPSSSAKTKKKRKKAAAAAAAINDNGSFRKDKVNNVDSQDK